MECLRTHKYHHLQMCFIFIFVSYFRYPPLGTLRNLYAVSTHPQQESLRAKSNITTTTGVVLAVASRNESSLITTPTATTAAASIFYHTYVKLGDQSGHNTKRIVTEQLQEIAQSNASGATIYYTTMGEPNVLEDFIATKCRENNLRCSHIQHQQEGFEQVTLGDLYGYCQRNPSHKVVYIHSKGSFHRHPKNERLRRNAMKAVFHQDCLAAPLDQCNTCSLQFYPLWIPYFAGNMWLSHCSYIQQLLPPTDYNTQWDNVIVPEVHRRLKDGRFGMSLYPHEKQELGAGRYADEHWIGSHPNLQPCDYSSIQNDPYHFIYNDITDIKPEYGLEFRKAPRFDWTVSPFTIGRTKESSDPIVGNETVRLKDFSLLAGRLFAWNHLYHDNPVPTRDDSWYWQWFPDGARWKLAREQYGAAAVDHMVNRTMMT